MKLVIAEKPSVAFSIAKALGISGKKDGYIEGGGRSPADNYIITWCVGHLVALAEPSSYDNRFAKWAYEDLPIIPEHFKYKTNGEKNKQFKVVKDLMHRKEVTEVINACDAGREGELIFRLVYNQAGCKKPIKRLWISSMEEIAIRDGFDNLKDGREYENLYNSALCRLWADWIVGINATRLFSLLYKKTLNIGRVQTPTLALLADRNNKITFFQKEKYYTVSIDTGSVNAVSERIDNLPHAEEIKAACEHSQAVCISVKKEQKTEKPPKLFDLTTLQRTSNKVFGYTAQQTLDYAQALYEKKMLTYPRTDSRYLTDDMAETATAVVHLSAKVPPFDSVPDYFPDVSLLVNNSKVTDHHAIIPTMEIEKADIKTLPSGELNILKLVICRLMCAVAEPYVYELSAAAFRCGGNVFTVKGKLVVSLGYKAIERLLYKSADSEDDEQIPDFYEGQTYAGIKAEIAEKFTSPPKQYTEDTLLSAMETAGNKEITDEAERKGLGTPATRAGIIEKLVQTGFAERKGKNIIPTKNGMLLISVLPDTLISASLTAEWENQLTLITKGKASPKEFMHGINKMITELVKKYPCITNDNQDIFKDDTDTR